MLPEENPVRALGAYSERVTRERCTARFSCQDMTSSRAHPLQTILLVFTPSTAHLRHCDYLCTGEDCPYPRPFKSPLRQTHVKFATIGRLSRIECGTASRTLAVVEQTQGNIFRVPHPAALIA